MKIDFSLGCWDADLFEQITSLRTDGRQPFLQQPDCVVNGLEQKDSIFEHNYISLLSKESLTDVFFSQYFGKFEKK